MIDFTLFYEAVKADLHKWEEFHLQVLRLICEEDFHVADLKTLVSYHPTFQIFSYGAWERYLEILEEIITKIQEDDSLSRPDTILRAFKQGVSKRLPFDPVALTVAWEEVRNDYSGIIKTSFSSWSKNRLLHQETLRMIHKCLPPISKLGDNPLLRLAVTFADLDDSVFDYKIQALKAKDSNISDIVTFCEDFKSPSSWLKSSIFPFSQGSGFSKRRRVIKILEVYPYTTVSEYCAEVYGYPDWNTKGALTLFDDRPKRDSDFPRLKNPDSGWIRLKSWFWRHFK